MNTGKKLRFSKTYWTNVIASVVAIATVLTNRDLVSPEIAAAFVLVVTAGNVLLRIVTDTPIDSPIYRWLNVEVVEDAESNSEAE